MGTVRSPFRVTFLPDGKSSLFVEPTPLSDAAAAADLLIDHPCGSNATCGKCRVRFEAGAPRPTAAEERLLPPADLRSGWRLACQATVEGKAVVEVPEVSRAASAKSFGDDELAGGDRVPWMTLHDVELPEPDLDWQWALEDSLARLLGRAEPPAMTLAQLRAFADLAAAEGGALRVLAEGDEVRALLPRSAPLAPPLGVAFDVGSTSLAGALVDMTTGRLLATASSLNPQVRFGADVISRIDFASRHADGNARLHQVLAAELNLLLTRLGAEAGVERERIWSVCVAANPAMLHTLAGVDVRPLGQAPYVGGWTRGMSVPAGELGLDLRLEARVRLMPMIRSNVGADTVAAVVAAGIDRSETVTVMIDLGTNCEVVVGNRERLLVTSTAAGPAFEGANIAQGMRAAPGAIDRVSLRAGGRLHVRVLGGGPARGLCGSGLIDAVSVLLRTGLVDASGRMHGAEALDRERWPELVRRATTVTDGERTHPAVALALPEEGERGVPVLLTALDVRQLQLIKGSIQAGIRLLLQEWGLGAEDVGRILIAGAFGSYLRKSSVLDIGLVPAIDPEKVHFIGNAAGVGARMALVDRRAWERAEAIRARAEYLELGGHPEYQTAFGECMGFHDSPALAAAAR